MRGIRASGAVVAALGAFLCASCMLGCASAEEQSMAATGSGESEGVRPTSLTQGFYPGRTKTGVAALRSPKLRARIAHEKFDRAMLRRVVGKPAVVYENEWVYVSKDDVGRYDYLRGVPFGLIAAYTDIWEHWGMALVTFDSSGHVSTIRTVAVEPKTQCWTLHWTICGVGVWDEVEKRITPATRSSE
jgi:hypothetical protein